MTDRVNNSNVPTGELIGLYNSVYKKLRKQSLMKKVVHIKLYCEQFMKLDNKVERIKYEIFTILTRFAVIRRIYFSNPFIRRSYLSIKKILKTQNE